jgi:pseudaminic acid synthase
MEPHPQSDEFSVQIADHWIGPAHAPFIVAELSANHGGSFDRAVRIIEGVAAAGADAVKFQAYTADSLTIESDKQDFLISSDTLWKGRRLHDLYAESATPYDWFPDLFALCREKGLIPFASPFDNDAVTMLESLDAPAYKIASFEAVDNQLISCCAATGKPLIISTGLCTDDEIEEAINSARDAGARDIILLHCNSSYPALPDEANLLSIPALANWFAVPIGYSDHTLGTISSAAACALGACLIEKHVIDKSQPPTADSTFSLTPDLLVKLVEDCRAAWTVRGSVRNGPTPSEQASLAFRRSLYVVENIKRGEIFTSVNVRSIRPGHGLPPKHLESVIGQTATRTIEKGEPLDWNMVSGSDVPAS